MPDYRRAWLPGGTFFFTLVTNHRRPIFQDPQARQILHDALLYGMEKVGPLQSESKSPCGWRVLSGCEERWD